MPDWLINQGFGDNTPGYKTLVAKGMPLPENRYIRSAISRTTLVSWEKSRFDNTQWGFPLYGSSQAYNKAIRRFYDAANRSDFSAAVTIGEAPKTFELIADTAKRLWSLYKGIRKGSFEDIQSALGFGINRSYTNRLNNIGRSRGTSSISVVRNQAANASDLFLEIKYGWTPLLNDIQNATEALQLKWDEDEADITIVGSGSYRGSDSEFNWEGTHLDRSRITGRFKIINQDLRNVNSFGLADLAGVAWELIPFSFVADWFVPVGDWIGAQTALTGLQWVRGCQSSSTLQTSHMVSDSWGGISDIIVEGQPYVKFQYVRDPISGPPSTIPILKSKDLRDLYNWDKVLTSLALLNSVFRGNKSRWTR